MNTKKFSAEAISFALVLLFMLLYYFPIFLNPNAYLTVGDGDGIKAFYVFASHIKNSVHYNQFEGMNYPYGQTHIFTDGQTVIAILFKFLSRWFPFFQTHCMGIYNVMMFMSYPLCALILASVLKRLNIPLIFVVSGSFAITVLSPQYFRLFGHPTLSYVLFVPLIWWLLIRYKESSNKLKWSLLICLNAIFWFGVHPYYIMLWVLFAIAYFGIEYFQQKERKKFLKREWIYLVLQTALPLAITRIYISMYDLHAFRSKSPYGFWEYYAEWNSVFLPNHGFHAALLKNFFYPNGTQNWEGQAYVGIGTVFITIYSLFKIGRYIKNKNARLILNPVLPPVLKTAIWASVIVLLFSMCIPFQLGLHSLVEHLSFLKQFRSLGRFAWIFYYVMSVYSVYILYLIYRKLRINKVAFVAYTIPVLYFTLHVAESLPYHNEGKPRFKETPNFFSKKYLPAYYKEVIGEVEKRKQNYQCLIIFPFYHVGSENFGKEFTPLAAQQSMVISYWTNMPLLNSSAARSPVLEAKNIMQFFSPSFFIKEIEKDLPGKKDFFLIYNNEKLTDEELYWFNKSQPLWKNSRFELRALKYEDVFSTRQDTKQVDITYSLENQIPELVSFMMPGKKLKPVEKNNYDTLKSEQVFNGSGALQGTKRNFTFLLKRGNYNLVKEKEYVAGFWYYNKDELRTQATCIIEQCDRNGNNCNWDIIWNPGESMIVNGDWSYVTKKFKPGETGNQISIFMNGDKHSAQKIYVDEFSLFEIDENKISDLGSFSVMAGPEKKYDEKKINKIIQSILSSPDWLADVKTKAIKNNIPLDSMLRLDAIWVIEHEKK